MKVATGLQRLRRQEGKFAGFQNLFLLMKVATPKTYPALAPAMEGVSEPFPSNEGRYWGDPEIAILLAQWIRFQNLFLLMKVATLTY